MTTELVLTLVAVFGSVALLSGLGFARLLTSSSPERRRLEMTERSLKSGILLDTPSLQHQSMEQVERLSALIPRSPGAVSRLRRRLMRAGYHTTMPFAVHTIAQLALPPLFAAVPFMLAEQYRWPLVAVAAAVGFQFPNAVLQHLTTRRQRVIRNGLPDALDLMIVCLESGLAIDQTIVKVSDELHLAYPALAEELRMLITETRAGKPRLEAFRNLAIRTGVEDVRSLVAMLVQTDRFGTSVAQALRIHAGVSRTKRRQRAEEAAGKIGVKLAFPLVLALFPAFFIVTLGPAVIQFVRVFFAQVAR